MDRSATCLAHMCCWLLSLLPCTHKCMHLWQVPCCILTPCPRPPPCQGFFLPSFHRAYWLGYQAATWPDFQWLDRNAASDYTTWGLPLQGEAQPDNGGGALRARPELCAAANVSLAGRQEPPLTWSDDDCLLRLPFMCRKIGGVLRAVRIW